MSTYAPPGVRTNRVQGAVTEVNIGQRVQLCLVGESLGKQEFVRATAIVNTTPGPDAIVEADPILSIDQVRTDQVGGIIYTDAVDFVGSTSAKTIDWSALTVISPPYILSGVANTVTGSGMVPDDYFYVITALKVNNSTGPVIGETVKSGQIKVTTTALLSTVTLRWTPVPGAYGYRIYRSLMTGTYVTPALAVEIVGGYIDTWTDTNVTLGTGFPPVANNAYKKPAIGETYYVDYTRQTQDFFLPTLYTRVGDIIRDFGLGSNIAKAATLAMGTAGRGNGALYCTVVAIPDSTTPSFQTAFDLLFSQNVDILIPLSTSFGVAQAAFNHCVAASTDQYRRERRMVWGPAKGTAIGAPATPGTMRWQLDQVRGLTDDSRFIYVAPWTWAYTQASDGSVAEEELDGCFLAASVAGLIAAQPDRATSTINKQVVGLSRLGKPGGSDLDNSMANVLASEGALIVAPNGIDSTVFIVRDSLTVSADSGEDSSVEIVMVEDLLRVRARQQLASLIGLKNLKSRRDRAAKAIRKMLAGAVKEELIATFNPANVSATIDPDRPTWVGVSGSWTPVYTIKEIDFNYSFDLSIPTA